MKILFLIPYPLKEAPSQRFRFEQYFHLLEEKGFSISSQSFWDRETWEVLYKSGFKLRKTIGFIKGSVRRLAILFSLSKIDYVFIHRECLPVGPPVIEWIIGRLLKKKIIYDFDDAIWLPNTSEENRIAAFLKWHSKVSSICKWSYKVSCGNSFLAEYASRFNETVILNPTTIDTDNLHNPNKFTIEKKTARVTIGWTGTHSTLKYIKPLVPILKKLELKFPNQVQILIIANRRPQLALDTVNFIPWSKETEIEDLLKMDIGIMPLSDDIWTKGKCGFKALQYMALEIPAVVSSVGVNSEIIDAGVNGFLCSSENEWMEALGKLIGDSQARKQMGRAGRQKIISTYSVSSNSSLFLDLFS